MEEDKVQRASQQWIRARKISRILQIELAIVNIDIMFEKSTQIRSRKVHLSFFNRLRYIFDKIVHRGTSKQRHCTVYTGGN
jgi:hypothetical protein